MAGQMFLRRRDVFPIVPHASNHYFVDVGGQLRLVLGFNAWSLIELSTAALIAFVEALAALGFNHTEVWIPNGFNGTVNPWHDGSGNLPFTKRLDGQDWSGSRSYSNIANEAPDFRFLNEAYWGSADTLLQVLEDHNFDVDLFLCYLGFNTSPKQGWNDEMVANGATKMQAYGALLANRWKFRKNIRWMLFGDRQVFDSNQVAALGGLITGLKSVTKACEQYGAELLRDSIPSDQSDFPTATNIQTAYARSTQVVNQCNRGYASGKVTYLMEGPFTATLSAPPVGDANPDATEPIRRHCWRAWMSARGGYMLGSGDVFGFTAGYMAALGAQAVLDCARLNRYAKAHAANLPTLAPTTVLVTSGNSADTSDAYITQMIDAVSNATLGIAYVPPADSGAFGVDMSLFAGTVRVRRYDPTDESYTLVGTFANSGIQSFTVPGNNAEGSFDDWVYEFDVP